MDVLAELGLSTENIASCCGNNNWLFDESTKPIFSINPANREKLASIKLCSNAQYEKIIHHATSFQKSWAMIPAPQRGEVIRLLGNKLREKKDALGSLVAMEMGKIKAEGDGEVQEMIDMADFAVGQSRMLYGKTMHSERPYHRMYEQWHPLGVVGVISAFNFPVAVWAWNAFVAAICGNSVVWKPAAKTPLTAIAVQHMCNQVMTETGYDGLFNLFLPAEKTVTTQFVEDRRIPLMSFTGSSQVGHFVAETVAKRLGRSLLECSGNNAMIVDNTADLKLAIPAIVFGSVGTAGQRCTSTRRLFVHEDIADSLINSLVNAYQQICIGDPVDSNTLMGPLIDGAAVVQFENAISQAKSQGGKLLTGGEKLSQAGYFVSPTIFEMSSQTDIMRDETFAPILYVLRYSKLEEAIALQNAVPQGLSSAIFTRNLQHAEQFLSAKGSDCGIANVNIGTSGAEIGGAFGGEKETGGGREAGSDSWKAYMRRQTNTINWSDELPLAQGIQFNF